MGLGIDSTLSVLGNALSGLAQRESATATNISNIDTPGYRPVAVSFEAALGAANTGGAADQLAMLTTNGRHLSGLPGSSSGAGAQVKTIAEAGRNDGNGVDIEAEMTTLTETQIRYSGVSRLLSGKLAMLKDVMTKA